MGVARRARAGRADQYRRNGRDRRRQRVVAIARTTLSVVLGFAVPQYGAAAYAELARFASTAEELGAGSLWVGDRLLAAVHPSVGYAGKRHHS